MRKRILNKLREKRGGTIVQGAVAVIITAMFAVACCSALGVLIKKQRLDTLAYEIRRTIEIDGRYTDAEKAAAENLLASNNMNAAITCTASGNIELGNSFDVTLTSSGSLGVGGVASISIPLSARASGKSEVYWK